MSPLCQPRRSYVTARRPGYQRNYSPRHLVDRAITVEGDAVVIKPKFMKQGEYYLGEIGKEPYLYRKINDGEIEVYGFAR